MRMKGAFLWLSGFWGGAFLGALAACPARAASLPVSAVLAAVFGYLGARK